MPYPLFFSGQVAYLSLHIFLTLHRMAMSPIVFFFIFKATQQRTRFSEYTYHYQLCKLGHSYFGYGLGILSSTYIFVVYIAPLVPCTDRWDVCTYLPSNDSWKISITNMNVRLWFSHFKIVDICHFGYMDSHMRVSTLVKNLQNLPILLWFNFSFSICTELLFLLSLK